MKIEKYIEALIILFISSLLSLNTSMQIIDSLNYKVWHSTAILIFLGLIFLYFIIIALGYICLKRVIKSINEN